jgi:hypothetical protein
MKCRHCAPIDEFDFQRTLDPATSSDSYEGSASPVLTPPVERPLKKACSAPTEFFLRSDGGAPPAEIRSRVLLNCRYAARLCDPPQQKPCAPHDYGHATFARQDTSADVAELGAFTFFPLELSERHTSLRPQT